MKQRRPRKLSVTPLPGGGVEIVYEDGVVITRDEVQHERILAALRKPGRPYIHMRPRE